MMMPLALITYHLSLITTFSSCSEAQEHIAAAVNPEDSASVMTTYGVNTLITDSGVIKYRIVTERWDYNEVRNPKVWTFDKGIFLEQFDEKFHVEAYIQADTAYNYYEQKIWELRGRVRIRTKAGLLFTSEELFWDQTRHEMYSNKFSRIVTPEREMQGTYFLSDDNFQDLSHYTISNSKGSFVKGKDGLGTNEGDTILSAPDSVKSMKRQPTGPKAKSYY